MARTLLIGRGPLPAPDQRHTGFAQLRTRHFHDGLRAAGHTVDLLLIGADHAPGLLEEATQRARGAEVICSAGPHRPGAVAVTCAADRPLHIDLPGAPLAELQALLTAPGPPIPPERRTAAHAMARTCLARADHLSVISTRQAHATLGQLALLGRTDTSPFPVHSIPIAFDFPLPRAAPRAIPTTGPVHMVLSGAFAPWLDDQTLATALSLALQQEPRLHLHVTGGGIEGHYTEGHARFAAFAADHNRIHLHGWVPHAELEHLLSTAHIGLCLDRPGAEPTLGSRTRVLLYAWMGLHIAASGETELMADLLQHGLATELPTGQPEAIAHAICRLVQHPPGADRAAAAADHLHARYAPHAILRPLLNFVAAPSRHPAAHDAVAALTAELEALQAQLSAVHHSPTWRTLSRLHRLLGG